MVPEDRAVQGEWVAREVPVIAEVPAAEIVLAIAAFPIAPRVETGAVSAAAAVALAGAAPGTAASGDRLASAAREAEALGAAAVAGDRVHEWEKTDEARIWI